jgi:hypothetical protein
MYASFTPPGSGLVFFLHQEFSQWADAVKVGSASQILRPLAILPADLGWCTVYENTDLSTHTHGGGFSPSKFMARLFERVCAAAATNGLATTTRPHRANRAIATLFIDSQLNLIL